MGCGYKQEGFCKKIFYGPTDLNCEDLLCENIEECSFKELQKAKEEIESLKICINNLSSDIDVTHCHFRFLDSENEYRCRCFENQKCNENDFISCHFRQLQREKEKNKKLQEKYQWYDHYKNAALGNKQLNDEKYDEILDLKEQVKFYEDRCDTCFTEWVCQDKNLMVNQNKGYKTSTENQRLQIVNLKLKLKQVQDVIEQKLIPMACIPSEHNFKSLGECCNIGQQILEIIKKD